MEYSRLYDLREDFGDDDALRATPRRGVIKDEFALLGGSEKPANPIRLDQHDESGGDVLCDVVWTTFVPTTLMSQQVVELFRQHRFTGWTTYPIEFYDKRGKPIPDYHGLAVTGRCAEIDRSRSRRVQRAPYVPGGKSPEFWVGLFFKDDRWDGSDIFLPEGTGYIFVTERVKNALETMKLCNTRFARLNTHETHI